LIVDIFSKRKQRAAGPGDVYEYDSLPTVLRVQLVHILKDVLSIESGYPSQLNSACNAIHDMLAREYGVFELSEEAKYRHPDYVAALFNFMLKTENVEQVLDVVELSLRYALVLQQGYYSDRPKLRVLDGENEVNLRFREHAVGYQFESGTIIRVDATVLHQEVIKPALAVLTEPHFAGANDEFLKAHEHYRHARYKESINECLKAFESTMKAICAERAWKVDPNATASKLIEVCFQNGLIPSYLQSEFAALRATLESGVPTVRNKTSGHGQGTARKPVPEYIAAYLLHSTAALILLLSRADAALP
jgi:hypothetical protein